MNFKGGILMEKVYLLQHTHQINEDYEDIKTLGIFTTYEKAYEAIQEYLELPGFKDSPDGFCIDSKSEAKRS